MRKKFLKKRRGVPIWVGMLVVVLASTTNGQIFDPPVIYGAGDGPHSVAIGDLDRDGDPDLAVANAGSNYSSVLLNNGDGTFILGENYGAGHRQDFVVASDLDGDGDLDLAVTHHRSFAVSIFLNNGDGTFLLDGNYGVGDGPFSIAASDLDGDGDPDLAVTNNYSDNISVLLNNGDGTFAAAVNYGAGDRPISVAISDLDGDGDPDLAVANLDDNTVSVFFNTGDGTFILVGDYGVGDQPRSVAISDLNGDGDLDLAVANRGSFDVSILLNNGDGTFADDVKYLVGFLPVSLAITDLDGDVDLDLAISIWNNVSIFLNNGDGIFVFEGNYGTGGDGYSPVAASDLDGDGDPDLVIPNLGSDNVSILLNRFGPLQGMKEEALEDLVELKEWGEENGEKKVSKGAEYARKNVLRSLNIDPKDPSQPWKKHPFWVDEEHLDEKHGHHVFISEGKAARRLEHLCDDLPEFPQGICLGVIELLLNADQGLAQIALDEAKDTPVKDPKDQKRYEDEIARAEEELEDAKKEREKEHYARAIGHYRKCWKHSISAKRIAEGKKAPEAILVSSELNQVVQLYQNTPNPFYRETVIHFMIPTSDFISLKVYDLTGRLVRTLVDSNKEAGYFSIPWDGRNELGRQAPNGIYFYRLQAGDFTSTKKLILLR